MSRYDCRWAMLDKIADCIILYGAVAVIIWLVTVAPSP